jgi:hypothetical protein
MLMTVKYQFIRSKYPEEIYQITLNHLNALLEILYKDPKDYEDVIDLVKDNIAYLTNVF